MEKEKQIEEMIKTMTGFCIPTSDDEIRAKLLYAAGYGNVKEAVKEFAKKLKKRVEEAKTDIVPEGCDMYFENGAICCEVIIFLKMDELIKEVCGE